MLQSLTGNHNDDEIDDETDDENDGDSDDNDWASMTLLLPLPILASCLAWLPGLQRHAAAY